jgi:hypothetical protein
MLEVPIDVCLLALSGFCAAFAPPPLMFFFLAMRPLEASRPSFLQSIAASFIVLACFIVAAQQHWKLIRRCFSSKQGICYWVLFQIVAWYALAVLWAGIVDYWEHRGTAQQLILENFTRSIEL